MRNKTNNWTKKENARRYFLHQKLKSEFEYSAKGRTVQVTEKQLQECTETAHWAVNELREVFGYNLQVQIPAIEVGQLVIMNPEFIKQTRGQFIHKVDSISGQTAMIMRLKGRWKKKVPVKLKFLIPVNEPEKKVGRSSKKRK
jgi:hypothetical protein